MRIYIFSSGRKTAFVVNEDGFVVIATYSSVTVISSPFTVWSWYNDIYDILHLVTNVFNFFSKVLKICDFSKKNDDGVVFEVYFISEDIEKEKENMTLIFYIGEFVREIRLCLKGQNLDGWIIKLSNISRFKS